MTDIEAEFVEIGELRAFLARPLGGSTGGMLLLPMITGINDQVREYAEDIAGTGVTALVWDPWHGHSADDTPREQLVEWMGELQDDAVLVEMNTLLEHAFGELGLSKVGPAGCGVASAAIGCVRVPGDGRGGSGPGPGTGVSTGYREELQDQAVRRQRLQAALQALAPATGITSIRANRKPG